MSINIFEKNNKYLGRDNRVGELVMPDGSSYSRDSSVTGLNNNVAVIGPSGTGKSSVMGVLNMINANTSFIVSDPKGGLYRDLQEILCDMGYVVKKIDFIHPENSSHYNPLSYVKSSQSIRKLAHAIVFGGTADAGASKDPYWEFASESLLCAFIAYLIETDCPKNKLTLTNVMDMLNKMVADEDIYKRKELPVYRDFEALEISSKFKKKESWACKMFNQFKTLSEKTLSCVISTLTSILVSFENEELAKMFRGKGFDFTSIGRRKTAVFVIVSDSDRSNDLLANLFYTQAMNELCNYADTECPDGKLEVPVTFLLDDFATNCRINGFDNIISNIRARNISAIMMLQSIHQLESGYGDGGETIMNNCDTVIYMGANSPTDAGYFSKRANKPLHAMFEMPKFSSWIFRRSEKPRFVINIDPRGYLDGVRQAIDEEYSSYLYSDVFYGDDFYCSKN